MTIGGGQLFLIAGPCVIESEAHALKMAEAIAAVCRERKLPYIFKASYDKANRTSIHSFRGPGLEEGLRILHKVREMAKIFVLTDVHQAADVPRAAEVVDVLQIPAFLCRQTDLLIAAGKSGCAVNVKKGQFVSPWDMRHAVEKVREAGGERVFLTERGASFGYNRAEGEAETISSGDLIALLVDVVSKNGNLLLDVGPEADGTIPPVQMERLKALGAWLKQNGEAIYDTVPWTSAVGRSVEDDDLRFTRKGSDLYVIVLGSPKTRTETVLEVTTSRLPELSPAHTRIYLLGDPKPLQWTVTSDSGVHVTLPQKLTGQYAYVLKVASCSSCVN